MKKFILFFQSNQSRENKKLIIFFSLQVKKIDLPYDKTKEQRRAFCFVEFKEEDAVKKITEQSVHKIKDQEVRFYGFH